MVAAALADRTGLPVALVDERLNPFDFAFVRVDEAVQEAKHGHSV